MGTLVSTVVRFYREHPMAHIYGDYLNTYGHIRSYPFFHIPSSTLLEYSSRVPEDKYGNLDRRLWVISQHNLHK